MIVTQLQQVEHTIHRNGASEREKEKKVSPNTMAILLATMNEQQQQKKIKLRSLTKRYFQLFSRQITIHGVRERKKAFILQKKENQKRRNGTVRENN